MEYACLFYVSEDADPGPDVFAECMAVAEEAHRAGALVNARGLEDASAATTVRIRDGKRLLTDGPFAETKEVLSGFFIFECASLDDAIAWATKLPQSRYGSVEVRPVRAVDD
jgi:hypothetical protein